MKPMFSWMRQISIRSNHQTTQPGKGSGFICTRNEGLIGMMGLL